MTRLKLFGGLCATVFLVNLARVIFAPLIQPVAADFGVTAASLGVIASATWLGSALLRLPTGYLLTKVSRHKVVIATGALLVVTSTFTGRAQSIDHLIVGAFLMGLSSGIYFIAANPLVSELFPQRVGRAIGIHGMSSQIAAVSAPLIVGGVLLVADWRTTFYLIALVAATSTAFLVIATRQARLPTAGEDDRSLLAGGKAQWRLILTGVIFMGAVGFLWNGLFNLYGDYLEVAKAIDPATGRLLLSLMFTAGIPAWIIGGRLADRVRHVPLIIVIIAGFAAAIYGLTLVEGFVLIALLSIFIGFTFFSLIPALDTYLLSTLPDRHRGSAYAWYSSTMMIFTALGSGVIGSIVASGVAYDIVFQFLAIFVGFLAVAFGIGWAIGVIPQGRRMTDSGND